MSALDLACPKCSAEAGQACRTKGGRKIYNCGSWRCTSAPGESCSHAAREFAFANAVPRSPT